MGSQMRRQIITIRCDKFQKNGKDRMLWQNMTVTAKLLLMRVRQILLEEDPSVLVMKNE